MTIKEMAQKALDVQSASNLSGVVRSFHEITTAMRMEHGMDTPTCNQHPIARLFAAHLIDLTRMGIADHDMYRLSYQWCVDCVNGYQDDERADPGFFVNVDTPTDTETDAQRQERLGALDCGRE